MFFTTGYSVLRVFIYLFTLLQAIGSFRFPRAGAAVEPFLEWN